MTLVKFSGKAGPNALHARPGYVSGEFKGALAGAITSPATNLTAIIATLNGIVNPNGLTTNIHFNWGLTNAYGNTTAPQNIGNGTLPVNVSANITGLAYNTLYHFQVVAVNADGTSTGADLTFTTPFQLVNLANVNINNDESGSSAVDPIHGFHYVGSYNDGANLWLTKINSATMIVDSQLDLHTFINTHGNVAERTTTMTIDPVNQLLYIIVNDQINYSNMLKIDAQTMTIISSSIDINDLGFTDSEIDLVNGFIYATSTFGVAFNLYQFNFALLITNTANLDASTQNECIAIDPANNVCYVAQVTGYVGKYNLTTFAEIARFQLDVSNTTIRGLSLDLTAQILYAVSTNSNILWKIDLTNFNAGGVTSLVLANTGTMGVLFEPSLNYVLIGYNQTPAKTGIVNAGTFTEGQVLTLSAGENSFQFISGLKAYDFTNHLWYLPCFTNTVIDVKIQVD